ncbi:MAG: hypothetical protein SFT81_04375 [Candidatus Caenarcaniphilales bacterium]|nr:hypothetical protein [Candidatus Caenarcaniphilales bacterium]
MPNWSRKELSADLQALQNKPTQNNLLEMAQASLIAEREPAEVTPWLEDICSMLSQGYELAAMSLVCEMKKNLKLDWKPIANLALKALNPYLERVLSHNIFESASKAAIDMFFLETLQYDANTTQFYDSASKLYERLERANCPIPSSLKAYIDSYDSLIGLTAYSDPDPIQPEAESSVQELHRHAESSPKAA